MTSLSLGGYLKTNQGLPLFAETRQVLASALPYVLLTGWKADEPLAPCRRSLLSGTSGAALCTTAMHLGYLIPSRTAQRQPSLGGHVSVSPAREVEVLKITISETPAETRWILHGRLVGAWVDELRMSWKKKPRRQNVEPCVIDLNDVSFIDQKGERLLRALAKKGVRFIASGIYIKYVLQDKRAR
jgi:hypothetical protein